ncbi:MAG: hypothetical protein IT193_12165 [Propionibacteriaceae bacterium]|nr:hypothetical protein [Propionibacteriaceae bacterium]
MGLLDQADYHYGRDHSGAFFVQPNETYRRRRPDLVRLRTIATSSEASPRWHELSSLRERAEVDLPKHVQDALERRRAKAEQSGALIDAINYQRLLLTVLPIAELPTQARYFSEFLNSVRFSDDSDTGPFPNTGVHVLEVDHSLLRRLKIASVWLRLEQDARLGSGDASHVVAMNADHEDVFASSAGLYEGVMLFDAYVAPLLAAGSPGIWAINVVRSFGSLIFNLGTFISGTDADAVEMLQFIGVPGAIEAVKFPKVSAAAGLGALEWWTEKLNLLFGVLSDLSTFTDTEGNYRPAKHLEGLLTIEQIFRRTTSMLVAHRDGGARRPLLFTILDSLEGVRGANLLTMCRLSHASKVLAALEAEMPADAAEVLLPAARRAVDALRAMQDGFFIRRQLATTKVELQLDGGRVQELTVDEAAAKYLKVLRDATHGHGSDSEGSRAMTDALLAHHDGHIPHDIGLLGYLYLLDLMMHPERVGRQLYRRGR